MDNKLSEKERQYQNTYKRKVYAQRKEAGICVRCGKEKSIYGKTMCAECLDKVLEYSRRQISPEQQALKDKRMMEYRQANREKCNARSRQRYRERRERGLCTRCGQPTQSEKSLCNICLAEKSMWAKEKRGR